MSNMGSILAQHQQSKVQTTLITYGIVNKGFWDQCKSNSSTKTSICLHHLRGPGGLCNIGYTTEMHLELKSHKISYAHNLFPNHLIILKFCTGHSSDTQGLGQTCSLVAWQDSYNDGQGWGEYQIYTYE